MGSEKTRRRLWLVASVALCGLANVAVADTITISGQITQSTQSGTGPAVNNPGLNNILNGDVYSVILDFAGAITSGGTYDLTGASLTLFDASASASESSFNTISLTISPDGSFFDISLLGCLTTGSGCAFGNQLGINFQIPSGQLNSENVAAQAIFGLTPSLDLLEDDGITDIQGSVGGYSYVPIPEPNSIALVCVALAPLAYLRRRRG
jgi:hypothetical protein